MSSPRRTFLSAFSALGALAVASTALPACSPPSGPAEHEAQSAALTISPGVTLSSATWWLIAANGTTTTGTVAVGTTKQVAVPPSALGLAPSTSYQLIVSGVASDRSPAARVRRFTTYATGIAPVPSAVTLSCAGPPDAGQSLVIAPVNSCAVIDGVSANPASANVGQTMALGMTAHDPDSGPAVLTYNWSSGSGSLTGSTTTTPTFTCTQAGSVTITARRVGRRPGLWREPPLHRHLHGAVTR